MVELTVYTVGRELYIESDQLPTCVKRHIPKHHKKFRAECHYFQKQIKDWLGGLLVDSITFYRPPGMTYWHRGLYSVVVAATTRPDKLVQLYNIEGGREDHQCDSSD